MNAGRRPVIWFELWADDVDRAKDFYGAMFGWTFRSMPDYDEQYWLIETDGGVGGAIVPGDAQPTGVRSGAVVYVSVDNLDDAITQCIALGGSAELGVTPIGDGTSFALVRDPGGIRLGLWSDLVGLVNRTCQAQRRHLRRSGPSPA